MTAMHEFAVKCEARVVVFQGGAFVKLKEDLRKGEDDQDESKESDVPGDQSFFCGATVGRRYSTLYFYVYIYFLFHGCF